MNHVRRDSLLTPDLRRWRQLELADTPFDRLSHTVDTRLVTNGEGRFNIPSVGIFLWRLAAHRLSRVPAFRLDNQRYLFNPLGCETHLFNRVLDRDQSGIRTTILNVPQPISRRQMDARLGDYYAESDSGSVFIEGVSIDQVVVADLSDRSGAWGHRPAADMVAIDPVLGRIAFGTAPTATPRVTFHTAFSADLGGGEYSRAASFAYAETVPIDVSMPQALQLQIDQRPVSTDPAQARAIQIDDSGTYNETLGLTLQAGEKFELRAAERRRPLLNLPQDLVISGGDTATEVHLNGLVLAGASVIVRNFAGRVHLQHCSLVPGLALARDGSPVSPDQPSIIVEDGHAQIRLDHCITGAIRAQAESTVELHDCILDATAPAKVAFAAPGAIVAGTRPGPGGVLTVVNCTLIGRVHARMIALASNSIFLAEPGEADGWPAPVLVDRRQTGCVRFCWLPPGARTPRRFRCQPELEIGAETERAVQAAARAQLSLTTAERQAIRRDVALWLKPALVSHRYGQPAYLQLRQRTPGSIRRGADDESEMGAFHSLFAPQREINLRLRLDEYLPFRLRAGIFYIT
jgi:hypothetical protein